MVISTEDNFAADIAESFTSRVKAFQSVAEWKAFSPAVTMTNISCVNGIAERSRIKKCVRASLEHEGFSEAQIDTLGEWLFVEICFRHPKLGKKP